MPASRWKSQRPPDHRKATVPIYPSSSHAVFVTLLLRGVIRNSIPDAYGEFRLVTRFGDVHIPNLPTTEPLRAECAHFVACICTGQKPVSDGVDGYRVVRMLEGAQRSMEQAGLPVALDLAR